MAKKTDNVEGGAVAADDYFGGAETIRSDLPRFAINDPAEGEDCLPMIEGIYEDSVQETIEGKARLVHRVAPRIPIGGNKRILLWGNYQLDAALPVLEPGSKFRATYVGKRPLKGGKTLKEITVEYPVGTKTRKHPFADVTVSD